MSDDLEGYEPAIEPASNNAEASVEASPAGKAATASDPASSADAAEKIGLPPGQDDEAAGPQPGPKAPRVWSGKSRALFRQLAAKGGVGADMADDLQPMEHAPAPTLRAADPAAMTASPAVPAAATQAQPDVADAAPVTPPPGFPELPDLPLQADPAPAASPPASPDPKLAEREQAIAAREAALAEREALLPDRRKLIDDPGGATIAWLKDTYGITDDNDLKTAVADLITDLSVKGLKIGVPDEHVTGMNARRATRMVKVYATDVDKRERALKDREAAAEKKASEERTARETKQQELAYVQRVGEVIAPTAAQYRFLHDREITGGIEPAVIVYEVMKEQQKLGQKPDLASAVKYADDYYRAQAEAFAKRAARIQSLFTPAAAPPAKPAQPAAPAKPQQSASPGGAPGPAPTPAAKPELQPRDPSDAITDAKAARRATLAKIRARNEAVQRSGQPTT